MKFAIPDSDSDSDDNFVGVVQDDFGYLSDESDDIPLLDLSREPRSKLGIAIRNTLVFSDSEESTNSEDEVGDLLDVMSVVSKTSYRNPKKEKRFAPAPAPRVTRKPKPEAAVAGPSWRRWEPSVADLLRDDGPSEYTKWIRETEADAWKHGHRMAAERQAELDQIRTTIRKEHDREQKIQQDRAADELQTMMEGLAVREEAEEKERTRLFEERQAQLWANIDAAIKESERRHREEQSALAAAERKRKEDEEARVAAAEKEALAKKAEAERVAKEKAEKEAADRAESERKEQEAQAAQAAAQREEDDRKAAADTSLRGRREWGKWVEVQKRMKNEVIHPLKANKQMRDPLLPTMRLIKRWLGQVVNTQEKILAVTNDLCTKFNEQLPSPASVAEPKTLGDELDPAYYYLLSHSAKALIRQAASEVEAKPEAAFPLARIIMGVMLRGHPAFGTVVYARLVKKCPFVVPYWPVRTEGQSREEFEKSTGQLVDESHAEYIRRMTGIMRMYFAVLALPLGSLARTLPAEPTPEQLLKLVPEEWRLPAAWTWVASALKPTLAKHPAVGPLLLAHLETVGPALVQVYGGKQMDKVFKAEREGVENGAIRCDTAATRATIKASVDSWEQTHQLPAPKGINW